eukprot:Seg1735.5 transcript_id=Seg1735.5/GoldUCD/mRNA.D3Y31 product="UTP-glucose-1-phosphate uridylyltransferase" protein_id=Seg1735.5/GoldUCD/D3Y31
MSFIGLEKRQDAKELLTEDLNNLLKTAPADRKDTYALNFKGFEELFGRFVEDKGHGLVWNDISPPPDGMIKRYKDIELESYKAQDIKALLDKLVVLKLNGGLGTSMGCTGPKSLISVRNDNTFLDLTVQQIENLNKKYDCDIPLVLMNSFNTSKDTKKSLRKYAACRIKIFTFEQSQFPRISKDSLRPIVSDLSNQDLEHWYPPGHGDIYDSFANSGLLDQFIREGKEFVFVSNIDNLGATIDLHILNFLINQSDGSDQCEFLMEVTDKTMADVKGGTLIKYEDKLRLLEIAQVPNEHVDDFKAVNKFRIFNTNNLWMKLGAMHRLVKQRALQMEIIINRKTLDNGVNIIQLETAVGAAIKCFEGAIGVNVPRSRFLPVKTSSDLFLVMSNLYEMHSGTLSMSHRRLFSTTPLVKITGPHFKKVKDFLSRFASIPDILELDHLTVSGDVKFGRNITLKGTVIIIANHGDRIDIPSGAVLENKIVSGNLRILDH